MGIIAPDDLQQAAAAKLRARDDAAHLEYQSHHKSLKIASVALRDLCLSRCEAHGGMTVLGVRERVKEWDKLLPKHQDGRAYPWDTCTDLIGLRIVVLSIEEVDRARSAIRRQAREPTVVCAHWSDDGPRAKGYEALHCQLDIPNELDVPANTRVAGAELQIVTAMQDAWSMLSHDDFYKSQQGVPLELGRRVRRLSAVLNLVDQEIQHLRSGVYGEVKALRDKVQTATSGSLSTVPLDETTLIAAAENVLRDEFLELRELGREAGFQVSGWPELARPGFETDVFLQLAREARIDDLEAVRRESERVLRDERDRLRELARAVADLDGYGSLFDRPIMVLQAALMFTHAATATPPFTTRIMDAIHQIRHDPPPPNDLPKGAEL